MAAASGSRCTITNVTTLIQSQRDALSLVQAAGTGLEAPSLKVGGSVERGLGTSNYVARVVKGSRNKEGLSRVGQGGIRRR